MIDYADFCYLWQLKEYRLDRIRDFFSTVQGRRYWLKYNLLFRSIIALILFFWPLNDIHFVQWILIALFTLDIVRGVKLFLQHELRRPVLTMRAMLILAASIGLEAVTIILSEDWAVFFLLLIIRFFVLSLAVYITGQFTRIWKQRIIRRAERKLADFPKVRVIGVTGSYGKTTVKEFLTHILKAKYRVVSTPKHTNTDIGVAQFILQTNFNDVDICIVEMGAYRIGEIKAITDIVHPTIGILTAINEQHLALFGTIQNTQTAKYELLRSLPPDGLVITNSDNPYCIEFLHDLQCSTVQLFGTETTIESPPQIILLSAKETNTGVACEFKKQSGSVVSLETSLHGAHSCMNLAPCILAAEFLGLSDLEIERQVKTLVPPEAPLHVQSYGQSLIIDDSYNSNPNGFKSALDYLSTFPSHRRRIVVTRGMLELGEKSQEIHEKIGGEITFVADELILISRDFEAPLRRGVGTKYRTKIVLKYKPEELLEYLRTFKDSGAVILVENRISELVRYELQL